MQLSIIIVNWNSAAFVRQCLLSIRRHPPDCAYEMIVIDNASFDSCESILRQDFPEAIFLQNHRNLGFARANNLAAAQSRGEVLLFLNPDTEVHADALQRMLEVTRTQPKVGVVGARLLNSDGSLQRTCIQAFPNFLNVLLDSEFLRTHAAGISLWKNHALAYTDGIHDRVEAISGACLMTPRRVYHSLGGFSERYFMYSEDTDYCYHSRRLGYRNYYVPKSTVTHHGGQSSGGSYNRFTAIMVSESLWRYSLYWHGPILALLLRLAIALKASARLVLLAPTLLMPLTRARRDTRYLQLKKWALILRWTLGAERGWLKTFPR